MIKMKNKIIDTHVHITPPEIISNKKKYCKREPYFKLLCSSEYNKNITGDELVEAMDRAGIHKSVVFGFGWQNQDLCKKVNDYTIKMIEKYSEKLVGFMVVNPGAKGAQKEIKRCYQAGLKGVGELFPTGQNFNIIEKKENENRLKLVFKLCQKYNLPVLIHLNEPVGHYYKGKTEDSVQKGELLAKKFPEVKFIYSHLGGGLCFYELMPEVKTDLKNVYYDTAAVPFLYSEKVYSTLKSAGILDKIIFGTDYPLLSQEKYIRRLKRSDLNNSDIKKILFDNSNDILVLED